VLGDASENRAWDRLLGSGIGCAVVCLKNAGLRRGDMISVAVILLVSTSTPKLGSALFVTCSTPGLCCLPSMADVGW
jgi:hypothetical protein